MSNKFTLDYPLKKLILTIRWVCRLSVFVALSRSWRTHTRPRMRRAGAGPYWGPVAYGLPRSRTHARGKQRSLEAARGASAAAKRPPPAALRSHGSSSKGRANLKLKGTGGRQRQSSGPIYAELRVAQCLHGKANVGRQLSCPSTVTDKHSGI